MSDFIKHECGVALLRLLKPLDFYYKKYGIEPDIITLSKSLGGGKSSISAYVCNKKVFKKSYGNLTDSLLLCRRESVKFP